MIGRVTCHYMVCSNFFKSYFIYYIQLFKHEILFLRDNAYIVVVNDLTCKTFDMLMQKRYILIKTIKLKSHLLTQNQKKFTNLKIKSIK